MEPRAVTVTGSFANTEGRPAHGLIRFVPSRAWVIHEWTTWACLAPRAKLLEDGSFITQLTPTDTDGIPWFYTAYTPAGAFRVNVPYTANGHSLRELIYGHRVGKSA